MNSSYKNMRYYKITFAVIVVVIGILFTTNTSKMNAIHYFITYSDVSERLDIVLSFKTDLKTETLIHLPSQFGGMSGLYKHITNLHVLNGKLQETSDPSVFILHPAQNRVIIKYSVQQSWQGPFANPMPYFHAPILQKKYFQFMGVGVLIYPEIKLKNQKLRFQFDWNLPKKWKIANSFGLNKKHQKVVADWDSILGCLFIAGDYQFYQFPVKGGTIVTAVRGRWPFSMDYFNQLVTKIFLNERQFWNDPNFKYYLVSLIPYESKKYSTHAEGYGLTNAFSCTMSKDSKYKDVLPFLLCHEIFHTWNKPDLFNLSNNNEIDYYWFSEGFTNYFTQLLNLKAGIITFPRYIQEFNKTIADYYTSPVNSFTAQQVKSNFWQNFSVGQLPYLQGEILAHNWNARIKTSLGENQSVSNFIKKIIRDVKLTRKKLSIKTMDEAGKKFHINTVAKDIEQLSEGKLIIPKKDSLGPCVSQVDKLITHKGKRRRVPQFILNKAMWDKNPNMCLRWLMN